ncbi:hypothetical protein RFI_27390 [Reticulomyxa filosa]|uniref:RRM domain-containing protein n=1 Tax=Reticulomyxa filosa TaxID=46433 RepID=X6M8M1_RETFI|nr:hypothetical protein RFI_27390 [Reticulomyxa filosa]|eukprot:ETO09986.1 hypothetical protein RFI_27390 [Reticulomyxa filosa]
MEAEAKKVMALSRQINEKDAKVNTNSPSDSNKIKSINQSPTTLALQTSNPNKPEAAHLTNPLHTSTEANGEASQQKEDQKVLDDRSVFVKNIDEKVDADELKKYFETCGAVERVTILTNKFTGQPKGCAYIQFKSKVATANALALNGKTWQGKEIEVFC